MKLRIHKNMPYKNFLILLLSLISFEFISAQNCQYQEYNKNIELAKKEYTNENFKEANKLFKVAFNTTDFPLGVDLRLALKVAQKTSDKIWMEQIAVSLAKGGIPLSFFKSFEDYKWYRTFYEQFSEYQKFYNENFNSEFRKSLLEIAKSDGEVNSRFHEWRTRKQEHTIEALVSDMTTVSADFQDMVKKFGFPTEKKIGYYYTKMDINELPTFVIIVHIYQRGELLYKEKLKEFTCNGSFTDSQYQQLQSIKGFGDSTGIAQEMEARRKNRNKE